MGSMWFWWLNISVIDKFTSVTDVADVYFTLFSQKVYIFLITLLYIKPWLFSYILLDISVGGDYQVKYS